jgi:hypothetical protein
VSKWVKNLVVVAGFGLVAAVPVLAHAQAAGPASGQRTSQTAEAPWYERFTFGSERGAGANAWLPRGEPRASLRVSPRSKWGVTFGLDSQAERPIDRALRANPATAGAFYDVSPNLRVGGAVTLPESTRDLARTRKREDAAREPGVKVESAFRF